MKAQEIHDMDKANVLTVTRTEGVHVVRVETDHLLHIDGGLTTRGALHSRCGMIKRPIQKWRYLARGDSSVDERELCQLCARAARGLFRGWKWSLASGVLDW